ncbi:MFS transporter [Sinimarinibacterium sp. NLF-5-8]|uniref:MFS transporter n=1 Tax=Sinimarinibacterium sp. NLF-5-8 TaxID=2698684 RepID=UPI00137BFC9C|nr:MFS transporter [Sinimarinibacterium sp. NLF-5-8]QHS10278.1 MFS transporter [Sinimarinibacterium sp. NLF-5-8]
MSQRCANGELTQLRGTAGLAYGALGLPLAFAALPLFVLLPNHYARELGLPLAQVGALLLLVRLIDAGVEPLIGRLSDHHSQRGARAVLRQMRWATLLLAAGMWALFFPQTASVVGRSVWLLLGLLITCLAHSVLVITHQAWGVQLGGDAALRSRVVAWREGAGLLGVIAASALALVWGVVPMLLVLSLTLLMGIWALAQAPRPLRAQRLSPPRALEGAAALLQPLQQRRFRRLLAVFACNGIASAIPAVLMLFFAQDQLRASPPQIALFLVLYFVCAALSLPIWLWLLRRVGLARAWQLGMVLAVLCFAWAAGLHSQQIAAFALICALTGVALGADLAVPGALLSLLIADCGAQGRGDGAYLGWWNLATKLNLALAAGAALPLLQWLGYVPGSDDAQALQRLAWLYALLPCALKGLAALLLQRWRPVLRFADERVIR